MAFDGPLVGWGSLVALVVGAVGSLLALVRLSDWQPLATARRRLLLGVPVGTVVTVLFVNAVFWVVQGAADGQPVVVGFRSWSLFYPVGMVAAPFAHNGLGHLTGNVLATLVFAPVAEYAWSHYPTERGSVSFGSLGTNPFARVGAFLLVVFAVGLATSLFTPGALIGFSGVVFAFAGFALVTRPLLAVAAIVGQQAVGLVYFGLQNPVLTATTQTRVVAPSWANVAIQGHALGLVLGVVLGLLVVRRRDRTPDVRHVWFAALVFAVSQALYAFYVPLSTERFVLFRGLGTAAVFLLAAVVATAVAETDRTVLARIDLSRREVATGLLLAVLFALALAAVPYNLADVSGEVSPEDPNTAGSVEVRDYTVAYVEGVPNQYVEAVRIPFINRGLSVNESGVVVTSDRRNAWEVVVSRSRLAFRGRASVAVGGLGWRERVVVNRTQWSATGGGTAYKVYLRRPGQPRRLAYGSDPATAEPVVNGTTIRVAPVPQPGGYRVELLENDTIAATTPVPLEGANRTLRGLTFNRTGSKLRVVEGDTVLTIATYRSGRR